MFPSHAGPATLIVIATGPLGERITRLAEEHAAFAPDDRRVLRGDEWPERERGVEVVVVNAEGAVCATLDARQGLSAAWIEDAFTRGRRRLTPPPSQ